MLKLTYQAAAFGPIDLEYSRPIVRVGSSEDNDLVLRHPSVQPHQCVLVFRGEKVLCLPPEQAPASETELAKVTGKEFGAGDSLKIGEVQFNLAHSSRSVLLARPQNTALPPESAAEALAGETGAPPKRYWCAHCQVFVPEANLRLMGLVGHAKHKLCPKCSTLLEAEPEPEPPKPPPPEPKKRVRLPWHSGAGSR